MKIENCEFCDWCCVNLQPNNRVNALFGVVLCKDCDNAIERTKPKPIPMNLGLRRFLTAVESGKRKPPWTDATVRNANGNRMCVPVPLQLNGKVKKKS